MRTDRTPADRPQGDGGDDVKRLAMRGIAWSLVLGIVAWAGVAEARRDYNPWTEARRDLEVPALLNPVKQRSLRHHTLEQIPAQAFRDYPLRVEASRYAEVLRKYPPRISVVMPGRSK
jgi:hypothetical protein